MKIAETTSALRKLYSDTQSIDFIKQAGFDCIDFSFFEERDYSIEADKQQFKKTFTEMRKYAEDKGLYFTQAHAPFASSYNEADKTERRFEEIVNSMRNASYLGIKHVVVHPCQHLQYYDAKNREILFEQNMEFYNRLLPYAEEFDTVICTENMWQNYGDRKIWVSVCATPEEFNRYIDEINSTYFKGCLDLGHTVLVGQDPADFIRKMGPDRLAALHVHDVTGHEDSHTAPYLGILHWNDIARSLKEIGYRGNITLEADSLMRRFPAELVPDGVVLLGKIARHIANLVDG